MAGTKIICALSCMQLLVLSAVIFAYEQLDDNEKEPFSIEDVVYYGYNNAYFNGSWTSEREILYVCDDKLLTIDVTDSSIKVLAKNEIFREADGEVFPSPDENYALIRGSKDTALRQAVSRNYSIYDIEAKKISKLADGQFLATALWSPTENAIAYVLNNDIYYKRFGGNHNNDTRRITFTGQRDVIFNGFSNEEENTLLWFSPEGKYLAFSTLNDSEVGEETMLVYGDLDDTGNNQYTRVEKYRYQKPGSNATQVTLTVINLTSYKSMQLTAPLNITGPEPILDVVTWIDEDTPVATWMNRAQNTSAMISYSLKNDRVSWSVMRIEREDSGWMLDSGTPLFTSDFVVLLKAQSIGKDGLGLFNHVTRFKYDKSVLSDEVDLTPGKIWVHQILGVDEIRQMIYFLASPPGQPTQKQLYKVKLDPPNSKAIRKCISCKFKSPEGNLCKYVSKVDFSTDYSRYVLQCDGPDPATVGVYDSEKMLLAWHRNEELREALEARIIPEKVDINVKSHGFNCSVRLLMPPGFDPSYKYPMLLYVYSGPDSQLIKEDFSIGFEQYMTTSKNVIYAMIDGRGSSSRGTAMMYEVFQRLGNPEIDDQITVVRKLLQMYSWIDEDRIGVWGHSYGGYATLRILIKDDEGIFKCGLAAAPVTDWRYYAAAYSESYLGLLVPENAKYYDDSSVTRHVEKLRDKKFMLIHGTADNNCFYLNSMALSRALVKSNILFDQFTYPDEDHNLNTNAEHFYSTVDTYFSNCFS